MSRYGRIAHLLLPSWRAPHHYIELVKSSLATKQWNPRHDWKMKHHQKTTAHILSTTSPFLWHGSANLHPPVKSRLPRQDAARSGEKDRTHKRTRSNRGPIRPACGPDRTQPATPIGPSSLGPSRGPDQTQPRNPARTNSLSKKTSPTALIRLYDVIYCLDFFRGHTVSASCCGLAPLLEMNILNFLNRQAASC